MYTIKELVRMAKTIFIGTHKEQEILNPNIAVNAREQAECDRK